MVSLLDTCVVYSCYVDSNVFKHSNVGRSYPSIKDFIMS